MYYVYLLRCRDGSLYAGITTDPARRLRQHKGELPGGARYTRLRPPVGYAAVWEAPDRSAAASLEGRLKHMDHKAKEALAAGAPPEGYQRWEADHGSGA